MYSQAVLISILIALAEARFGQEQGNGAITAIGAVTSGGQSGQAATLAGQSISFLLAAANPCGKLTQADLILTQLGEGADAVAAARGLVAAEQNFNPFVVSVPSICSDTSLPVNPLLRGIVPLIDPAVTGSDKENANSAASLTTQLSNTGMSVADVMVAAGFSNFTTKAVDGTVGTPGGASSGSVAVSASASVAPVAAVSSASSASVATIAPVSSCVVSTKMITVTRGAAAATTSASASAAATSAPASSAATPAASSSASTGTTPSVGIDPGQQVSSLGLDFGTCTPTMKFEAGLNGRKTTENTFQAIDPVVNKGQQEALNPGIITNRICDQLTNVCGASQAGKDACIAAKATVAALGTRDASTADAWNTALGFAGTNTNPDNAPQAGLVGHT